MSFVGEPGGQNIVAQRACEVYGSIKKLGRMRHNTALNQQREAGLSDNATLDQGYASKRDADQTHAPVLPVATHRSAAPGRKTG